MILRDRNDFPPRLLQAQAQLRDASRTSRPGVLGRGRAQLLRLGPA
jgi:hypothetical protein